MGMLGGPTPHSQATPAPPLAGRRALVIEDSAELADELNELLSGQGMHVLNVNSVEQVNGGLVDFSPQACIVDLNLRGGRGAQMLALVGKLFPTAGAILIADAVDADYVTEALAQRTQQTECVGKPISPARLLGAVQRCVAAWDDAEERQRAGSEIGVLRGRLHQANETANAVLANLSHELRTPLNAIIGFSEMVSLGGTFGAERLKDYAQDIHQSGLHMLEAIESVLTFAALESGQRRIDPAPLDVAAMLERQLAALAPAAHAAGVTLSRKIAPGLPRLQADQELVAHCLGALAENAIEFARRRGKRVGVVARTSDLGEMTIQVADNGPGIGEDMLARILEPFGVGEDVLSRHRGGLGLGLTIARKVMALHDGELKLKSRLGVGTVVTLLFPEARSVR